MKKLLLLAALVGCAPTYRVATKRCPPTATIVGDVLIGTAGLALGFVNYSLGHELRGMGIAAAGEAVFLGANLAEAGCRR